MVEVAYIACGSMLTGKQLDAVPPPGSGQSRSSSPMATGIDPNRYMQLSTSGVPGRQSGEVKLALLTLSSRLTMRWRNCAPPASYPARC